MKINSYSKTADQISQIPDLSQTGIFGYDNVDRLTSMNNGSSNESYSFDSVGNRTASHRSSTYGYQPFNRLTSTASSTQNIDANGNTVAKAEGSNFWRYGFDYENRVSSASTRRQTVRYIYDALGRRVRRHIAGGKENTKYTYDGQDVVIDDNAGVLTKYQNGLSIDSKLKQTTSGVSKYFLQDHLGSTLALTNSSGAILEQNSYDSFGNPSNSGFSNRYQFTGREYDSLTGLTYYRERWYDSSIGRFISEDPIGLRGGDVNLFGYVWNSPNRFRDPTGLFPFKLPAGPGPNGSNLPQGWQPMPEHYDPTNPGLERWVSPNGDEGLEFHPGKTGETGWEAEDHWHKLKPRPGRDRRWDTDKDVGEKGHLPPGAEVDRKECHLLDNGWKMPDWMYPPSTIPGYPQGNPAAPAVATGTVLVVVGAVIVIIILA